MLELFKSKATTVFPHIVSTETILFLNLEIQRSQYIRPKVTVHEGVETIQGRKLYEEIRYMKICKEDSVITSLTFFVWWPMKHSGSSSC